jgi:dipeptidyl aminopeptidase/acylaminoacyl peptidase
VLEDNVVKVYLNWSPDGRSILYGTSATTGGTGNDLWVLPLSGGPSTGLGQVRKPVPFLQTPFNERFGQFSPDGRWVAYASNESGRFEIYVAAYPEPSGKRQVSTGSGTMPRWRGDGSEIFYLAPDNKLMTAAVNGRGESFEVGAVKPLFETSAMLAARYAYDVSPDGQRFLINSLPEQAASAPITVVVNWLAGVRK